MVPRALLIDFAYVPETLRIAVGDTVTWTNGDGAEHSATDFNGNRPVFDTQLFVFEESRSVQWRIIIAWTVYI